MLLALNKIKELEAFFKIEKEAERVIDFRVTLQLNMRLEINLLVKTKEDAKPYFEKFASEKEVIRVREIIFDEEEDKKENYQWLFPDDPKLRENVGPRRRLSNLIDLKEIELGIKCPILTFYSYKGGMGRSTTLAAFASYLAMHYAKKVVIIDCDFEAPGFTNYFDLELGADSENQKSGIVEYLLDYQFAKLSKIDLDIRKDYVYEVAQPYVGDGSVFIVPAGNLSGKPVNGNGKSHLDHYLESLARLDISSPNEISEQLKQFLTAAFEQLELDENSVILFDSRTGFNDIFSILASISNSIVGFFGINKQTKTGLYQFLDTFGMVENKSIYLAHSFATQRSERVFKSIVDNYFKDNAQKFENDGQGLPQFASKIFGIERNDTLSYLGVEEIEDDYKEQINGKNLKFNTSFIKIIREKAVFKDFFETIVNHIQLVTDEKKNDLDEIVIEQLQPTVNLDNHFANLNLSSDSFYSLRESFLKQIFDEENYPESYADGVTPKQEDFYFRDCMKGIFNRDAFLIVGYKGTGKTSLYQAFRNPQIVERLCKRQGKSSEDYVFINVLPSSSADFIIATDEFSSNDLGTDTGVFYKNYWLVLVWSSIYSSQNFQDLFPNATTSLPLIKVDKEPNGFNQWFRTNVFNSDVQNKIIEDLKQVDSLLKTSNKRLVLSFDHLDFAIKPEQWSKGISPLINYWRTNPFSRIMPKIFLRADLFEGLSGINNAGNLKNNLIDLSWQKDEIFEYLFKYIFKTNKLDFYKLILIRNNAEEKVINLLAKIDEGLDLDGQLMPVFYPEHLPFLVENFFGRYADRQQTDRFGLSYEWFFSNLQDAKGAISIRPFLDLLKKAGEIACRQASLDNEKRHWSSKKNILPAFYYTHNEARHYCAREYFYQLSKDNDNSFLTSFRDYMQEEAPDSLRSYEYSRERLDELLEKFKLRHSSELTGIETTKIKNILIKNGILSQDFRTNRNFTRYEVPYLYRNFFKAGQRN